MNGEYILTDYIERAMSYAVYEEMEKDGAYAGTIPPCLGVLAFAPTLSECKHELRSVLEEWMVVGFKLGHELPVVDGIDLNFSLEPVCEPLESL